MDKGSLSVRTWLGEIRNNGQLSVDSDRELVVELGKRNNSLVDITIHGARIHC